MWSFSTLHVGPDQPDPRPDPITLTLTRRFGGLEIGTGNHAARLRRVFGGVFAKNKTVGPKYQPRSIRPTSCTKVFCAGGRRYCNTLGEKLRSAGLQMSVHR